MMQGFDYARAAELYVVGRKRTGRLSTGFLRFETAARALQYAVEELRPASLTASTMEVDEARFDSRQMRELYESADYPLPRGAGHANDNRLGDPAVSPEPAKDVE